MTPLLLLTINAPINPHIQDIINDATKPHQAKLQGIPDSYNWSKKPRIGMGNNPGHFKAFITWGQVYNAAPNNPVPQARVQIQNVQGYVLKKSDKKWHLIQFSSDTDGAAYRNDFKDDNNKPIDRRLEPQGTSSVKLVDDYNYHFWPTSGRATIDPNDIIGIYTCSQARLVPQDNNTPKNLSDARLLISMGADYWESLTSPWDNFKTNGDAMIGRFRFITPEWQWFHATTLNPDQLRENPPPIPKIK